MEQILMRKGKTTFTCTIIPALPYPPCAQAIGLQVVLHGFRFVGSARRAAFDPAEMKKRDPAAYAALLEEHKRATGQDKLAGGGYPDMGTGRYAALLGYDKWLAFANAQRVHYNYVEGAASAITFNLLSGIYFPVTSALAALTYIVGREVFAAGYTSKAGANGRMAGALILDLGLVAMLGLAVYGGLKQARLV